MLSWNRSRGLPFSFSLKPNKANSFRRFNGIHTSFKGPEILNRVACKNLGVGLFQRCIKSGDGAVRIL
jgi:hypothetical protein